MNEQNDDDIFMTNKDLVKQLMQKMESLDCRLQKTEQIITKYNGLRERILEHKEQLQMESEEIVHLKQKIKKMETELTTKDKFIAFLTNQLGWLVAIATLLYHIFS